MHNQYVLACLDETIRQAGIGMEDVDAVAFNAGPGSFTGVRVGASVSQALAVVSGIPVVPVSASWALARRTRQIRPDTARVVTAIYSRARLRYVTHYPKGQGLHQPERDRLTDAFAAVLEHADTTWTLAGDWPDDVRDTSGAIWCEDAAVDAALLCELAYESFSEAGPLVAVPPQDALPIYVPGDTPWRPVG